ncbi:MAG: HAD-IC family P-type ATPase, partial [Clostridia bacterium]|nr:HAD-IC family P-type ATPase [Clostridia bacterium]
TTEQVAQRVSDGLVNVVQKSYSKSYLQIILSNTLTFFNLLGLIVTIALIVIQAPISRFFFLFVYIANILIGIIQEVRAKITVDKLSIVSSKSCRVIRNGDLKDISPKEIVLDDILFLGLGNQIPTDCLILDKEIEVNESLLTGESLPVKKHVGDTLYAGSYITSGSCHVQAIKVGTENYVEQLSAKAKQYKKPHSELMSSLQMIIKIVGVAIIPIATLFILKAIFSDGFNYKTAIDGTSTVVIGMIPSGMFLLTSMALAVGIIKLARQNTLVQDLYSLEMLARVDTICFDKTGTITDGRMNVKDMVPLTDNPPCDLYTVVGSMLGSLSDNNQTAIALNNFFGQNTKYVATTNLPFNSARKLSAVTFENIGTFAFGAPEFVLSKKLYKSIETQINQYAAMGLRILLLAHSEKAIKDDSAPNDFMPVALIIIEDNIRKDAASTIQWFKDNDVEIKVISGDNPVTVSEVSKRVGIDNADKYISLEGLTDNEVFDVATRYTVFGRVTPEQKAILVKALKSAGHTTAMTGDGVNDILALKEADCAITVAAGSDAARNVSHLVLMDNNFNSLPKVVHEGRRVINNVQSSASLYLMKTLFTILLSILVLVAPYMKNYPFSLSNMIILETFIIGIPSFFLSLQPNDARVHGKFISYVLSKSLPSAIIMVINVVLIEVAKQSLINVYSYTTPATYTTMAVLAFTYAGLIALLNICKPLNIFRSCLFFADLAVIVLITVLIILNDSAIFETVRLSPIKDYWHHLLIVLSILLFDLTILDYVNRFCEKLRLPKLHDKKKNKN